MSEPNKELAEHCRFAHFTALTVSVAVLLALSSDPNRRTKDTLSEVSLLQSVQENWAGMKGRFAAEVARVQGPVSRYVAHGTIVFEDEPIDFAFNVDLTGVWVPHHKHLYQRDEPFWHQNRIARSGSTIDDFADRWNWVTDCIWIYVPNKVRELVTINRVLVGNRWMVINQTVPVSVTRVEEFPNNRLLGSSEHFVEVDIAPSRYIQFGEFPSEHAIQAGMAHITILGGGGSLPPAYRQVELSMHVHQKSVATTWQRDAIQAIMTESKQSISQVEFKLPTEGEFVKILPLPTLGREIEQLFVAGESFPERFPSLSRLHESYRAIEVPHLAGILTEQMLSAEDRVLELVGLKIPFSVVARWGILIAFAVYVYFAVHTSTLLRRLREAPEDPGWKAAWIALYPDTVSKIVAFVTAVVIPGAAAALYFFVAPIPSGITDRLIMYVAILAMLCMNIVQGRTFSCLFKLSRTPEPSGALEPVTGRVSSEGSSTPLAGQVSGGGSSIQPAGGFSSETSSNDGPMTRPQFSWHWATSTGTWLSYVLLEHRQTEKDYHLDLMLDTRLEGADQERSLLDLEFEDRAAIAGDMLFCLDHGLHRRRYLWFEGELNHPGGTLTRIGEGRYRVVEQTCEKSFKLQFSGVPFEGMFVLTRIAGLKLRMDKLSTE